MTRKPSDEPASHTISAQPRLHQRTRELQAYGTVLHLLPLDTDEPVRLEMTEQLNQLLADTDDPPGLVQEVPLADCRANVLPAPFAL